MSDPPRVAPEPMSPEPMSPGDERLYDLAIARATLGLSSAEEREFCELRAAIAPEELAAIEDAVLVMSRALGAEAEVIVDEEMPEHVRLALAAAVPVALESGSRGTGRSAGEGIPTESRADEQDPVIRSIRRSARAGWFLAAASLLLSAGLLLSRIDGIKAATRPPLTEQLVDAAADVIRLPIRPTPDGTAGASGEIVWSDSLQKGYMRLRGVPANDATVAQYQLWIVDVTRDSKPVDGGVFNVRGDVSGNALGTAEVVIGFEPRLPVANPAAFAVTAERPGGVVVSDGPILFVTQAKSS